MHTEVQDGADPSLSSYRESWAYVDGLGRTRITFGQADTTANDAAPWVASGLTTYDGKGAKNYTYLDFFYAPDPSTFEPSSFVPTGTFAHTQYDSFGRPWKTFNLDGTISIENQYHALSVDSFDAADEPGGSHFAGSFATSAKDGHGRGVAAIERNRVKVLEAYETTTQLLSTGEPEAIIRTNLTSGGTVVRTMTYDTLGRMVGNYEPDTGTSPTNAWAYAYNDNGDLVGTTDARNCGANYTYDAGGRILGEDYVPCTADHAPYTAPSAAGGFEVSYSYDTQEFGGPTNWNAGRLVTVADRAGQTLYLYDARGRTVATGRKLSAPGGGLAPRSYNQYAVYDAADRLVAEQTGANDDGSSFEETSAVYTNFSKRGLVKSVGSDNGDIITSVTHDADGLPLSVVYGDALQTTTTMTYTARRQLWTVQTSRGANGPPALWTAPPSTYQPAPTFGGPPSTFQLNLENLTYTYDEVDNPIGIADGRSPNEWPAGAQPVSRSMAYDDLYRLTEIDYDYANGGDSWTSPFDAEDKAIDADPQRGVPMPRQSFASRVNQQTFAYDWLGNTVQTGDDDASGFYDRSLGSIVNGLPTAGPYQIQSAAPGSGVVTGPVGPVGILPFLTVRGAPTPRLTAAYDAAGNMTDLSVTRTGDCLPSGAICSQRFLYTWDEVGRLARARRWDVASPGDASADNPPVTTPDADLQYTYDATDDRAIKQASDGAGNVRYTLYPLDPLELRQTTWNAAVGDYDRGPETEAPYIFANGVRLGRLALAEPGDPEVTGGETHVFLELADHLGSTSVVIDRDTSELVEASAYMPYGGAESDYRPTRWDSFREDYRFTGKEEDVEVGLQYFGKRYLAPGLGRWISPDPLAVQSPENGDLNVYAYVRGRTLRNVDPDGLDDGIPAEANAPGADRKNYVVDGKIIVSWKGTGDTAYEFAEVRATTTPKDLGLGILQSLADIPLNLAKAVAYDPGDEIEQARPASENDTQRASREVLGPLVLSVIGEALGAGPEADPVPDVPAGDPIPSAARAAPASSEPAPVAPSQCPCFAKGTPVLTPVGLAPIEALSVGNDVLTRNPETGEIVARRILRVYITPERTTLRVTLNDGDGRLEEIRATENHPFWVSSRGWTPASQLRPGDALWSLDNNVRVVSVSSAAGKETVYNLEVDEVHTYVVGRGAALVHNSCPCTGTYGELRRAGVKDAHHIIQDAAVRDIPGYSQGDAPAVQLPGPSTRVGSPHYEATQVQRQAGGGTYAAERRIGYKALRRGGLSPADAKANINNADAYFQSLGVTPSTPTRIPGNR